VPVSKVGLRPYGPGKFDKIIDSEVYWIAQGGCDDECGSDSERDGVWYGLLRDLTLPTDVKITLAEDCFLRPCKGAILSETSNGFVSVQYYTNRSTLEEAWRRVKKGAVATLGYSD
jgi:hypothetical protein